LLFVDSLRAVLRGADVEVLGATRRAPEALRLVETERPDVFVVGIDVVKEPEHGMELIRRALARQPELKVIAVADVNEPEHVEEAFAAGAAAFIARSAAPDDVVVAIRQTFDHSIHLAPPAKPKLDVVQGRLTARELETLRLVASGYSNAQVAGALQLHEQTVKFHLSNVFRKLGVSNRTQATRAAFDLGLLGAERAAEAAQPSEQQR
jgi:two-component system response regulator DesR